MKCRHFSLFSAKEQGPDSDAKFWSFEKSFEKSFEYFSNSFVKEVFKGLFKGAKFCIVIGTLYFAKKKDLISVDLASVIYN